MLTVKKTPLFFYDQRTMFRVAILNKQYFCSRFEDLVKSISRTENRDARTEIDFVYIKKYFKEEKTMRRRHNDDLEEAPKVKVNRENFREALQIFEFILPYKWSFIIGMFLLFLSSMVFMLFPHLIGIMVDTAQGQSEYDLSLTQIGFVLAAVLFAQGFVSYTRVILFANVSERGIADIRSALYQKMISLPITCLLYTSPSPRDRG